MSSETPITRHEDILTEQEVREAAKKTCEQVLEEALLDFIQMGRDNGMTEGDIDYVLEKIINDRAERNRSKFKLL